VLTVNEPGIGPVLVLMALQVTVVLGAKLVRSTLMYAQDEWLQLGCPTALEPLDTVTAAAGASVVALAEVIPET